jgi:hypothetical protein
LAKLPPELHVITDLNEINKLILPLKVLADRERKSIYGLSGMVYTPHIDDYMQVSIKKASIMACLKTQGLLAYSEVEIVSKALECLHKRAKNNDVVEYNENLYQRRFSPLKLSKSGKVVNKWAKYWLLQLPNGNIDPSWEEQVREIWPANFIIRTIEL